MRPRKDSLKTLTTIAQIIQKSAPSENPLAHVVMIVRQEMKVDVCSLYLLQDKALVLIATDGLDPSSVGRVRMNIQEGLTGLAVEKLQPIIVKEAQNHPRFKYFPETGEEKFRTFAAVPLMQRDQIVGVLTVQTAEARDFGPEEIELLKLFAFQLAGVVQNLVTLEILRAESPESNDDRAGSQLKGIAVAPGFGLGSAFFLRPGVSPVILSRTSGASGAPKDEWKKLSLAIRKASRGLMRLEKRLQKKFTKSQTDIFYSHRMILSDKSFLKKLKAQVEKGDGALDAVRDVIGDYIKEFEKIEDPHFRERSADLEDLRQRILENLSGSRPRKTMVNWQGILVAENLVPSDTARLNPETIQGIVTEHGGVTSHAAIIARSLGIPAVMGVPGLTSRVQPGDTVIVDGNSGSVYVNPEPRILKEYEKIQEKYADRIIHLQKITQREGRTQDGERILVEANIGLFSGLKKIHEYGAEGIGLYRTEFPFMVKKKLLNEEEQLELYRKIIEEVRGLPVTFRLLDAGGDKPIEALGPQGDEDNPFLGYRSIRLSLSRPEILKTQMRALLRASALGPIRILVPMISGIEEIKAVRQIFEDLKSELRSQGVAFSPKIPLGLLVEVPSAVWLSHLLIKHCDFFSIGTNDLIQYTLAVDRNNERVAQFFEPLHPAVLQAIARVARVGREEAKRVSVCGEIAGDPFMVPLLIGLGVTGLSLIPRGIPLVKNILHVITYDWVRSLAEKALGASTVDEVKKVLEPLRARIEPLLDPQFGDPRPPASREVQSNYLK